MAGAVADIGSGVEVRATPAPAYQVMDQRGRWPLTWLTIGPTRHHKRRPLLAAKGRSHLTASGDAADLKVREDLVISLDSGPRTGRAVVAGTRCTPPPAYYPLFNKADHPGLGNTTLALTTTC